MKGDTHERVFAGGESRTRAVRKDPVASGRLSVGRVRPAPAGKTGHPASILLVPPVVPANDAEIRAAKARLVKLLIGIARRKIGGDEA